LLQLLFVMVPPILLGVVRQRGAPQIIQLAFLAVLLQLLVVQQHEPEPVLAVEIANQLQLLPWRLDLFQALLEFQVDCVVIGVPSSSF
jgi:hypothetical protein